ncbi:invasion associated locus B family protein [Rubrimonas cliftonensis]|uniref:Invasion protein IalB, involved in pathogenesis n=1 Tax=Rubrimonas cliftonensis TaxID=89524 RepID=A0A1H3ZBL7_9RHOB|nr:invasion associated locus B family protein [Rubrimonas cliftonensis]SEA20732.1 Invasion protein IalB, involved in pathogenesis [Rubrimonas cliftonensis]
MQRSLIITLALLCLSAGGALAQTEERAVTRTTFGDWTRVCADATGECALEQIGKTANGEDALLMQVQKLPEPRTVDGVRIEAIAVIRVPFNIVLANQLRLRVDQGEVTASQYLTCNQQGCIVQAPLRPEQLESFRRGARAELGYTLIQGDKFQNVAATVSLSGFTRGFEGL